MGSYYECLLLVVLSLVAPSVCLPAGSTNQSPAHFNLGGNSVPISTFEHHLEAVIKKLSKMDQMFFDSGIDFIGGNSAIALHSMIINTRAKSIELGRLERERLWALYAFTKTPGFASFNRTELVDTLSGILHRVNSSYKGLFQDTGTCPGEEPITCNPHAPYRTIDGSCNNLRNPRWGMSFIPMRRFVYPQYDDGVSSPRTVGKDGTPLPNARKVSQTLHSDDHSRETSHKMSHMVMQWGQFLDHDLTSTPMHKGINGSTARCCIDDIPAGLDADTVQALLERDICFPIPIPHGESWFSNRSCLNFVRSIQVANAECHFEPVEQLNQVTAYIDASQVYGSTEEEEKNLRMYDKGYMKFHGDGLLPRSHEQNCIPQKQHDFCFLAGDERVNEQMGLTSLQTAWMREHNRISQTLGQLNPHWNDERMYQETRKIIGAMMQKITYDEYLAVLLNEDIRRYFNLIGGTFGYRDSYNPNIDSSIRNVFATSVFRFGHSLIRGTFTHLVSPIMTSGQADLKNLFGNTTVILGSKGETIHSLLGGMTRDHAEKFDRFLTSAVTQNLFLDRDGNSLDLASLNIQRGRDHGLPGYNAWRRICQLPVAHHFGTGSGGLVDHPYDAANILGTLYKHPDDIDAFPGMMSERVLPGSSIGPTVACLLAKSFQLLKEGDRFWYENSQEKTAFTVAQLHAIRDVSLARVLCDTTKMEFIQPWAMRVPNYIDNPIVRCSEIKSLDLSYWRELPPFWSAWSYWSECGLGIQQRYRTCSNIQGGCQGAKTHERPCSLPPVNPTGSWAEWTEWSSCIDQERHRYRSCFEEYRVSESCSGSNFQAEKCKREPFCPFPQYSVAQHACLRTLAKIKHYV